MTINQPDHLSDLAIKRNHLFSAEQFYKHQAELLAKRDELEEKILTVKTNLDKIYFLLNKHENPDPTNHQKLEQLQRDLSHLKQEMQTIDSLLDEWEDLSENQLIFMLEELLNEIWNFYPNQYSAQILQWKELKTLFIQEAEIKKIRKLVDHLLEILHIVIQERSNIKGRGLLRYIFGVSPNAVIERHLFYAHDMILNALPDLKQAIHRSSQTPCQSIFQAIFDEFNRLKDHCKAVWGFRHIDRVISTSEKRISLFSKELQEKDKAAQKRAAELNKELHNWLYAIDPSYF